MDALSKELLTWSLVKVANPGDHVIALHILPPNRIVDKDGKSCLISIIKTFDSVLAVYQGFCNLKQVVLSMKICRGTSIRKIIVREAYSNAASIVVLGTATKHRTIWSSTSVAKYCSRKLPDYCSVLAARNGKVVFQREAIDASTGPNGWPLLEQTLLPRQDTITSYPSTPNWSSAVQNHAILPVAAKTSHITATTHQRGVEIAHHNYSSSCRLFKYQELQSATSNFTPENMIGKGGHSRVYRGALPNGKELAVKVLNPSEQVLQEFVREIEIINDLNHNNIISLFGFCIEENNLLLVYDLLPRGSLEENLHGSKKNLVAFGWKERYKVALGVAEALDYLHNHSTLPVIHRDVKSSNILLSKDFEPQLSDFGLAKLASVSSLITCTDVAGTFGYLAPEYFMHGKVTDKIDVYAFGVVLLELLSGRKPISNEQPKGQESLVMWAKPILEEGKVSKLLDPSVGSEYNLDEIERMVLAAILCIRREPRARPQMSLILKLLEGDGHAVRWARLQVNVLENRDVVDEGGLSGHQLQSHLNVALHDVQNDYLSSRSISNSAGVIHPALIKA